MQIEKVGRPVEKVEKEGEKGDRHLFLESYELAVKSTFRRGKRCLSPFPPSFPPFPNRRGVAVMLTAVAMAAILPIVGLAVDVSLLFLVKAKLNAAADAAALSAARSLNLGLTLASQITAAQTNATTFFNANFPDGYLFSSNKQFPPPVIAQTGLSSTTVSTTAQVDAPTYFLRIFGVNSVTVKAAGTASRRDVNMLMVLDRSGSLANSGSCAPMKTAAANFVTNFAPGRDKVGLITFNTGIYTAFPISTNFLLTSGSDIVTAINSIACVGATNTSNAMYQAYQALKNPPAGQPLALSVIVLFTDGIPNGIVANYPVRNVADTRYGYNGGPAGCTNTGSTCNMPPSACKDSTGKVYPTAGWNPPATIFGLLAQSATTATNSTGATSGLYNPVGTDTTSSPPIVSSPYGGCAYQSSNDDVRRDMAYIPPTDTNGVSNLGYKGTDTLPAGSPYYAANRARVDTPISITKAGSNNVDNLAMTIRNDTTYNPVIFTIGLGKSTDTDPPDFVLLARLANDPTSPIYDNTKIPGLFVQASDASGLQDAFQRIASEVLRLSH